MSDEKPFKWIPILVGGFPFAIILLGILGMFFYFKGEEKLKEKLRIPYKQYIDNKEVDDFFTKISELVGGRRFDSKEGIKGLRQISSLIDGTLGEENTGRPVKTDEGLAKSGGLWYRYTYDIVGKAESLVVPVVVSYSGGVNEQGEDLDAANLAVALTVAQSMLDVEPAKTVRFVFVPEPIRGLNPKTLLGRGEQFSGAILLTNEHREGPDVMAAKSVNGEDMLELAISLREKIAELAE